MGGCVVSLTFAASIGWSSCSVYDDSLLQQGVGGVDSSAGTSGASGSDGSGGSDNDGSPDGTGGTGATGGASGTGGSGGVACPATNVPWWSKVENGCQTTGVPRPEDKPPAACEGANIEPIVLAVSRLRLSKVKDDAALTEDKTAWKSIGLDNDDSCTLSDGCFDPGDAGDAGGGDAAPGDGGDGGPTGPLLDERACKSQPGVIPVDGQQCLDNTLGNIFQLAAESPELGGGEQGPGLGINEGYWNCAIHRGEFSIIIRVSDYNGRPDDPQVRLDLYSSIGIAIKPGWSCLSGGKLSTDWHRNPPWLPTTHWRIARRSLALNDPGTGMELPRAKAADPVAYVRGGYLVARLPPGSELWLNGEESHVAGYRAVMNRGITVGKLVKATNGVWTIEQGTISAVTFPTDVVQALREIGFCENFCGSYQLLVDNLNIAQDALTFTADKLPNTDCDGISMGVSFTAKQVQADRSDLVDSVPVECPNPKDPRLPRKGCVCQPTGGCTLPDGG